MRSTFVSWVLFAAATAEAFTLPTRARTAHIVPLARAHGLRGGHTATPIQASAALSGVLSGALAIPATSGIAAVAGSLCYIRQAYIFSLSYGLAMLGIGGAVLATSPTAVLVRVHAALVAAYGARLFAFLLWRQKFQPSYDGEAKLRALDKTPRPQRTPIILSTAFFYSLLSSPLIFHLQVAPLTGAAAAFSGAGCILAALSFVYEAVADQQKSLFKMGLRAAGKPDELCTTGLWATSRHANYFGEIAFWLGSFAAGLPALFVAGSPLFVRALRAVASGLGLAGIVFIMLSATKRLEARQADKYRKVGGVPTKRYDGYYAGSNALFPKMI